MEKPFDPDHFYRSNLMEIQAKAREIAGRIFGQRHYPVLVGPNSVPGPSLEWVVLVVVPTGGYRAELFDLDCASADDGALFLAAIIEALEGKFDEVHVVGSAESLENAVEATRARQASNADVLLGMEQHHTRLLRTMASLEGKRGSFDAGGSVV